MDNSGVTDNLINMTRVGENLYEAKRKKRSSVFLRNLILGICLIAVLAAEALFITLFSGIYVIDGSMLPTLTGAKLDELNRPLPGGDYIYINVYDKPDYGDIVVVYRHNLAYTDKIIKRAVAFGGDTVEIKGGVLYVNGKQVKESYVSEKHNSPELPKNNFGPYEVAKGRMFLLGDNRDESVDSRTYGDFSLKDLVGVVPDWSLRSKSFSTGLYTFFHFTIFGN